MGDVMIKLIEADKSARKIIEEANEYYQKIADGMDSEKQKFKEQYKNEAASKISEIKETEETTLRRTVSTIKMTAEEKIRFLEKSYFENHAAWEKAIYDRCIRG